MNILYKFMWSLHMLYYKFYHQFPNAAYHFFIFLELMTLQDIETI